MEKTIEERANMSKSGWHRLTPFELCKLGAKEQHEADMEKAIKWLKDFEGGYIQDYQIEEFRKAME